MPNVQRDLERELGRVDGERVGRGLGDEMSSGMGDSMKKFAVGGAVAGIFASMASSIGSSMAALASEAVGASDATDKFKSTLGFAGVDTSGIEALTKSTRAYADQTVYDLADIQGITSQLAANGVSGYDKLAEAAGNLNAVAGGNSETFKSVGMALTQTAGAGKLSTENWNQLADAIPGASGRLQEVMKTAGAFEGNFREAMEKGEISSDEFNAALMELGSEPIAVEAAKSVTTFEGMIGNLQATVVGGMSDALTSMKPLIGEVVNGTSEAIGAAMPAILSGVDGAVGGIMAFSDAASGVSSILFDGDFTGPIFGFEEDSAQVDFLFGLREAAQGIADILFRGDFTGGIFGLSEDSPFVDLLFTLRESAIAVGDVFMQAWPGIGEILGSLVEPLVLLVSSFSPLGLVLGALAPIIPVLVGTIAQFVTTVAGALVPVLTQLAPMVGTLVSTLSDGLAQILPVVSSALGVVGSVIATIVPVIGALLAALMPIVTTLIGAVVPLFAGLASVVLPLVVGAIQLLAAVLMPVIEILSAILVPVLTFVVDVFAGLVGLLTGQVTPGFEAAGSVMGDIFGAIGEVFTWIYETIIVPIVDGIVAYAQMWGQVFTWLWENILSPVFTAIGDIFSWIYNSIILPIVTLIVIAVQLWGMIFNWLWTNIISPVFAAIGAIFTWIYENIITPIVNGVIAYVQLWGAIFNWLWTEIISPTFTAMGDIFTWLYENIIQPVWSGIQTAISSVADWITNTLWPGIQTVIGWLGAGFETMGKTITDVWNNIKAAAVAPINFVINSVYNDGIRKLMNDIVDTLGLDANWKMPHVSEIALASGGVLPGYTPGRDVHDFYSPTGGRLALSGGEAIMRPEFTAALGRGGIDALNAAARSGGISGVQKLLGGGQAFAGGGIWEDITGGISGAADWIGDAVGNVAKIMSDPSGAVDALIRTPVKAILENIGGGNFGSMMAEIPLKAIDGIAEWAQKNILPPAPSSGEWVGGNTLERLRPLIAKHGLMITDTYRDPAYNASVGGVSTSYHLDKDNPAVDVAGSYGAMDAFAAEVAAIGGWRQLLWEVAGHFDHVHIANQGGIFGDLPTKKYDSGGYLQPGYTQVYNGTGKPEPVFTSGQWADIENMANGGGDVTLLVDGDPAMVELVKLMDIRIKGDGERRRLAVMAGG